MARRSPVRYLLRIRAVLEGIEPPIARELLIDRDADVGLFARALTAAFGLSECSRHEFTDSRDPRYPTDIPLAQLTEDDLYEHQRRVHKQWPGSTPGRRWGDRWTMIDARDPSVVFEESVQVAQLFRDAYAWHAYRSDAYRSDGFVPPCTARHFRCDHPESYSTWRAGFPWWLRVEVVGDDIDVAGGPVARLVGGSGAAPFDAQLGAHRHARLLAAWADPDAPEHAEVRTAVATAVGPWASFDPDAFEIEAARTQFELAMEPEPEEELRPTGPDRLLCGVSRTARAGLRRHLSTTGIGMPSVITADEAAGAVRVFRRLLLDAIGADGSAYDDVQAAAAELTGGEDAARELLEHARRTRLIYRRSGNWRVRRDALDAASDPVRLWGRLAQAVGGRASDARAFLLLAIADGSIADEAAAIDRIRTALGTAQEVEAGEYPYGYDGHGYDGYRYEYSQRRASADTEAELAELRGILSYLPRDGEPDDDLLTDGVVREFARACLRRSG